MNTKIPIRACVNCGTCCLNSPCGFGKVGDNGRSCAYVVFDENNQSSCSIAKEIIKDPTSKFSPAFGAGCCMSLFNERRQNVIIKMFNGEEQYTGEYLEY